MAIRRCVKWPFEPFVAGAKEMHKLWRQSVQYNEAWRQRMKERLTLMVGGLNGKNGSFGTGHQFVGK